MAVRAATLADAEAIAELGDAVVRGEDRAWITWETLAASIGAFMASPGTVTLVDEHEGKAQAALAGTISGVPWNTTARVAYVFLWWSRNPFAGLRVLRRFRTWAAGQGATVLLSASRDERTGRLCKRMGLRALETNYLGAI